MRKKILSLCMVLVLCLSLLPATALAAGSNTVYVGGVALTGSSDSIAYATTNENGEVITEGATADNYNIKWDGATLTLRNAAIKKAGEHNNESIAVYLASGNMNLVLVGKNTVDAPDSESASSCGIHVGGSLTISGQENASLTVFGGDTTNGNSCGIYANGTITMESGTVNATGESASAASYGIDAVGAVTIENGTVKATSGKAGGNSVGIHIKNSITINGGDVTATAGDAGGNSYGIHTAASSTSITVNGGSVTATSGEAKGDSCGIFVESKELASIYSSAAINGGSVTAYGGDAVGTGWYSCGMKVDGKFTISGGTITAKGGDARGADTRNYSIGLFAHTDLTIKGGTVIATGVGAIGTTTDLQLSFGIFSLGNVNISGGDVTGIGGTGGLSGGIVGNYILTITGGTVVGEGGPLAGTNIQYSAGINGMDKVEISGGTVTATGGAAPNGKSSGIFASNANDINVQVTIEDSTVTATGGSAGTGSYGILAETTGAEKSADVTINGNSVVRANTTDTEGVDSKPISGETTKQENSIIFENGVGTVYGNVTLREDLTIASGETLTIPEDAALTIPEGTTLTNNGRIQNDGNLQVKGEITGNAVTGSGTIQGSGQWPGKPEPVPIPPTYAVTTPETTGGTVTVSPSRASSGRTVTITATPDLGYELESLTVLDSRGNEIALTDKGDGKYTFTMPASRVTVEASFAPAPLPFEDVAPGAWYESAVRYAYFHNIMEGMRETEFSPTTALTRAMAAQIIYNLEGQPDLSSENLGYPYEDVDAQAWYGNAVYWARITGVATGYGDGTFQPGDCITRQEFAQMLYNYAKYKGYDLTAEGDLSQFPDSGSVADWAEAAMSWANGNKLINGHDDGTLEPDGTATRAQAASILMKFGQNLAEN